MKNGAEGFQNEKIEPWVSKSYRNGTKRKLKYRQREPKREPQGAKRELKSDQNASKSRSSEKVAKRGIKCIKFWRQFGAKSH